jgi:hypothetical protein
VREHLGAERGDGGHEGHDVLRIVR